MPKNLLITGGAGYIGSHTLVELIQAGHSPVVLDNLSNSDLEVMRRVHRITGVEVPFILGDVRDRAFLDRVFADAAREGGPIDAVLHFAALKAVGESVEDPLRYYDNNVAGTVTLLNAMLGAGVKTIVFSSSATVYGDPKFLPYTESHPLAPTNPYGWSKLMVEQLLRDICTANDDFSAVTLRYFNPIGAHPSGLIGEDPKGLPNNLFPFLTRVAVGKLPSLGVFGSDYATEDGTGVRDYLHVVDLARGHVDALGYATRHSGFTAINLGTGRGTSVLQMVKAFENASGRPIPLQMQSRRAGDLPAFWADASLARELLGWEATFDVDVMCQDGWRWQFANPDGYRAQGPAA
jgi:UDP-glucose 4-epimerase